MKIRNLKINNFRGISEANLDFPKNEKIICLIGPGDSTKSTILKAIQYVFWPNWQLPICSNDFYNCDTNSPIQIELTFDNIPDEFKQESKYGLYLRGSWKEVNDEPNDDEVLLTARLIIDNYFEPCWFIVCNRLDDKKFNLEDRRKLASVMLGLGFSYNLNWRHGSLLSKYIDPHEAIYKNIPVIEKMSKQYADYSDLDAINNDIKRIAENYGVGINGDIINRVSLKANDLTSTVQIYENDAPINQRGFGSQKLLSLGLHTDRKNNMSLLLIDELELGLEPYRQRNLIYMFRRLPKSNQVIFTTHSPVLIEELSINQLVVIHSLEGKTNFNFVKTDNEYLNDELQGLLRSNPDTFFTPKIIICEGATEIGFIRALDKWMARQCNYSMACKGISYTDGKGGSRSLNVAYKLLSLGYSVSLFIDDDRIEDEEQKNKLINDDVHMFSWSKGKCIETELLPLFSVDQLNLLFDGDIQNRDKFYSDLNKNCLLDDNMINSRISKEEKLKVAELAASNSIFKKIEYGERLGDAFFELWNTIPSECIAKKTISKIINWVSDE